MTAHSNLPATVRAVLFDAVGTLIYPSPPAAEAYLQAGQQFGTRLTLGEVQRRFRAAFARCESGDPVNAPTHTSEALERQRWQQIVAAVFDDVSDVAVSDSPGLFQTLWAHFERAEHWALFDDVISCWQALAERGLELGIASNFDARLHTVCDGLPHLQECRQRFVSSEIGDRKPGRDFFRSIERSLGLRPQELLLIGDDLQHDYHAALAAGWNAVWLVREPGPSQPGVRSIRSLREL